MARKAKKMTVKRLFGMRVREFRKQRGYTQQALADRARLSLNMIGLVERGTRFVSPETIETLSKVLKVTPDELFKSDRKDAAPNARRSTRSQPF